MSPHWSTVVRDCAIGIAFAGVALLCYHLASYGESVLYRNRSGRWQIVNGTPELAQNMMLLDTLTGDSWVICSASEGERKWCTVVRTLNEGSNGPALKTNDATPATGAGSN